MEKENISQPLDRLMTRLDIINREHQFKKVQETKKDIQDKIRRGKITSLVGVIRAQTSFKQNKKEPSYVDSFGDHSICFSGCYFHL